MAKKPAHGAWFLSLLLLGSTVVLTGWVIIPLHNGHVHLDPLHMSVFRYISTNAFGSKDNSSSKCATGCRRDARSGSCSCGFAADNNRTQHQGPKEGIPSCPTHASGTSKRCESGADLEVKLVQPRLKLFGPDFEQLQVAVRHETPSRLHVKISPAGVRRWEIPQWLLPRPQAVPFSAADAMYKVLLPQVDEPFSLVVTRSGKGSTDTRHPHVFNSSASRLVFKEQYLELSTSIPSTASLYGLGQRTDPKGHIQLPRDGTKIVLWNYAVVATRRDLNLYGSHPFYMQVNQDGTSSGVLLLNSNGMEITLHRKRLTYRVIGGVFDLYFFLGPHPEAVMQQYQEVVGRPAMPPYWSLGFHSCRWGYRTLGALKESLAGYQAAGIPVETIWSDIDYMDRFRDFTFDRERYPEQHLRKFVDSLHAAGQRWVPIMDAGIPVAKDDAAYQSGLLAGVFIRDKNGDPYIGQVWPGATHYPDFLSTNQTWPWWQGQIQQMHDRVPFDGLWIDMNEPTNFCLGEVCRLPEDNNLQALMGSDRQAAAAAAATLAAAASASAASSAEKKGGRLLTAAAAAADGVADHSNLPTSKDADNDGNNELGPPGDGVDQQQVIGSSPEHLIMTEDVQSSFSSLSSAAAAADQAAADQAAANQAAAEPHQVAMAPPLHEAVHDYLEPERRIMRQLVRCQLECQEPAQDDLLAFPPYALQIGFAGSHSNFGAGGRGGGGSSNSSSSRGKGAVKTLGTKTLPASALGVDGSRHYDTHNLYGLSQAAATHDALVNVIKRRPFLLSRSTFSGAGRFAAHWGGDNAATWFDLRASVVQLVASNMWGMPLAGADICGFIRNTTEELCARWASVGAFYTFARAHNSLGPVPQELYRWPTVAAAARKALGMRYRLLPYLYTAFYHAHTLGGTVARPLFFEFPGDEASRSANDQWLLGDSILVSAVVYQGKSTRTAWVPTGTWYDLWAVPGGDGQPGSTNSANSTNSTNSMNSIVLHGPAKHVLQAPVGDIPLHVRAGSIIPMQQAANTTSQVMKSPVTLVVAMQQVISSSSSSSTGSRDGSRDGSSSQPGPAWHRHQQQIKKHRSRLLRGSSRGSSTTVSSSSSSKLRLPSAATVTEGKPATEHAALPRQCTAQLLKDAAAAAAATSGSSGRWQDQAADGMPLVACGMLYLDSGESLTVPDPAGSSMVVYFTAGASTDTSRGWVRITAAAAALAAATAESPAAAGGRPVKNLPLLKEVVMLGMGSPAAQDLAAEGNSQQQQQTVVDVGVASDHGNEHRHLLLQSRGGGGGGAAGAAAAALGAAAASDAAAAAAGLAADEAPAQPLQEPRPSSPPRPSTSSPASAAAATAAAASTTTTSNPSLAAVQPQVPAPAAAVQQLSRVSMQSRGGSALPGKMGARPSAAAAAKTSTAVADGSGASRFLVARGVPTATAAGASGNGYYEYSGPNLRDEEVVADAEGDQAGGDADNEGSVLSMPQSDTPGVAGLDPDPHQEALAHAPYDVLLNGQMIAGSSVVYTPARGMLHIVFQQPTDILKGSVIRWQAAGTRQY